MKTKSFVVIIIASLTIINCTKTKTTNFLYLYSEELKPLGIELNDNGAFYKNMNPNWKAEGERNCIFQFYCTSNIYLTTTLYTESDLIYTTKFLKRYCV